MAFNGDREDPSDSKLRFYKYFFEPLAQDHPALAGGGIQIGLEGAPLVETLEEWQLIVREMEDSLASPPMSPNKPLQPTPYSLRWRCVLPGAAERQRSASSA